MDRSTGGVQSDALRFAQQSEVVARYVRPGEQVEGFGFGGSESLTLFLRRAGGERFVRKVLSERLVTPRWQRDGGDVMLPPWRKARSQTTYLIGLPASVKRYFPEVLDVQEASVTQHENGAEVICHEFTYDMTYIGGVEVGRFIQDHRPAPHTVALLYAEIFRLLREQIHVHRRRVPRRPTLEASYFTKIEKRLALAADTAPRTFNDLLLRSSEILINGRRLRNVPALLRAFRTVERYAHALEPRSHSLVVGDTNTENIKIGNIEPLLHGHGRGARPFTYHDLELRFLDPRAIGFHENGADTGADDSMYDNKPWHNSLGHYDQIHGEHFDLDYRMLDGIPALRIAFHPHSPYAASYHDIGRHFAEVMTTAWQPDDVGPRVAHDDPFWIIRFAFVMGTHFMAMPPFHFSKTEDGEVLDDPQRQRRPLALYAEGIEWLNLALEMLEGRQREYLGVAVPSIYADALPRFG
ncbi:MAG TPA: hypothetical protein VHW23_12240 [Kofleriaceae bacterium]|nr:hypothetical protein [Kofleriaceae bacterium]